MRKTRRELARGIVAMLILGSLAASAVILTGSGQYVPRINEYSSYDIAVNPPSADYIYPLANYSLVRGTDTVGLFSRVGFQHFESGVEFQGTLPLSHADMYGTLDIHEMPSTAIKYTAHGSNSMKFELTDGTGAIKRGSAVVVGSEQASGVIVMSGGASASISGQDVIFTMPANSTVTFRADTQFDPAVGGAVADGLVSAEMYIIDSDYTVEWDTVSFDSTDMWTVAASGESVDVQVLGSEAQKAVIIHVSDSYLDYASADELSVTLDGTKLSMGAGISETLWGTGDEASYFATKTDMGYDVVVYIPQNADSVISIKGVEPELGVDGLVTLLAAIGIVGVAVVALIKTD